MTGHTSRRAFVGAAAGLGVAAALGVPARSWAGGYQARKAIAEIDPAAIRKFAGSLDGHAIGPADAGYDEARRVWNAAFDRHPGLIAVCGGQADVVRAVNFARDNDLKMSVRAGSHSLAGKSMCDGGLVIDLSRLKMLRIDPAARIAYADPGVLLGDFDEATQPHGLATTLGTEPSTGIAGLTLGGGLGWLMGKYGLACDNLRSVDIVLADGRALTASPSQNAELFWAVRGAGANFGVVTALEYQLHPAGTILGGVVKYPPDRLRDVLKFYRDFTATVPGEVGLATGVIPNPGAPPTPSIAICYCGDLAAGEKAFQTLRAFGPQLEYDIKPMTYLAYQQLGAMPPGLRVSAFTRSAFLASLDDAAIDAIAAHAITTPGLGSNFVIEYVHGAATRVAPDATAFPHRSVGHNFSIHSDWVAPSQEPSARTWGDAFFAAMQPYLREAVYSNYLGDEGAGRVRAAYGANYARLAALKNKYDPDNLFRMNQNIVPTA